MDRIQDQVRELVAENLNRDIDSARDDADMVDEYGIDSMDVLMILMAMNE